MPCCSQPCTDLLLLWSCSHCPPEGWGIALHDQSAPAMGKETGWARPHFPSTLLSCGSPDSTRKASSWSRGFVRVATRYQMGKVEGKAVPGKGLFSAPAGGKGRRKFLHAPVVWGDAHSAPTELRLAGHEGYWKKRRRCLPTTSGYAQTSYSKSWTILWYCLQREGFK